MLTKSYLCTMKLSVIIPVYCVEDTLDRCVESVISQNYSDMEIILVDDGSPDGCPQKCDDWSKRDQRIKVIHKVNGGLSDARNAGIEIAQGQYLTFIDSDDYLSNDTLPYNMDILEKHPELDIVEYPILIHAGSKKEFLFQPQFQVYTNMGQYWLTGEAFRHTYACNKIFRREVFSTLRFPIVPAFEDAHILPKLLDKCSAIATTDKGLYYYTWNENGITSTADGSKIQSLLDAYIALLPRFNDTDRPEVQDIYLQALNIQMEAAAKGMPITLPPFKRRLATSKRHSTKTNIKILILNTLGIGALCRIYSLMSRI